MKSKINTTLEEFARKYLSPSQTEREAISRRYKQLQEILPGSEIFQSGSYPRETTTTPVHDLDVIWVMPESWQLKITKAYSEASSLGLPLTFDVTEPLSHLAQYLRQRYQELGENVEVDDSQSHSVKISFPKKEKFSIDVVPAVKSGSKNKNQDDIYLVPEIQQARHKRWDEIYKQRNGKLRWILSDPKFYLNQAKKLNALNTSYRKTVKLVKNWRRACNSGLTDFELQSFHMELVLAEIFTKNQGIGMYEAINQFFTELPNRLKTPTIPDVANANVFIDSYLDKDTDGRQRQRATQFAQRTQLVLQELDEDLTLEDIYSAIRNCLIAQSPWTARAENIISVELRCIVEKREKRTNSSDWRYRKYNLPKETLAYINGPRVLTSKEEIHPGYDLTFSPLTNGIDFDDVRWLVVNTGIDPLDKNKISGWRGFEFHESEEGTFERKEYTEYLGEHWIECHLLKNGHSVGIGRFYVNIVAG